MSTADTSTTTAAGPVLSDGLGLVERLRSPWHHADCRRAGEEIEQLRAELAEWCTLRDPVVLHANLLRGIPAALTPAQVWHLVAADRDRLAKLEAEVWRLKEHAVTLANTERQLELERWQKAARLVLEAEPDQMPLALDALRDVYEA